MNPLSQTAELLWSRRLAVMLPLGFASGLPLALTAGTLQAWLTMEGVDLATIGLFTLIGLPYTVKFLWAPVIDRLVPPWLGRRRGWMVITQLCVAGGLVAMACVNPRIQPEVLAAVALLVAFCSASLDIVLDAYRTDTLLPAERGFGAAVWVNGYRLALLIAGAGALLLADRIGWPATYILMAGILFAGIAVIFVSPEPQLYAPPPTRLAEAVGAPLKEFFSRPHALGLLAVVVLYKLGDAFASALQTTFFISGLGFTATAVGSVKGVGIAATLIGALAGGVIMTHTTLLRALLLFGGLQAVSNLGFAVLAWAGNNSLFLFATVVIENVTGGMGTAAFVAFVMSLCNHRYTATQFALLSSVEALGRVFSGKPSAELVALVGWGNFFLLTFLIALPGLGAVWLVRRQMTSAAAALPSAAADAA